MRTVNGDRRQMFGRMMHFMQGPQSWPSMHPAMYNIFCKVVEHKNGKSKGRHNGGLGQNETERPVGPINQE